MSGFLIFIFILFALNEFSKMRKEKLDEDYKKSIIEAEKHLKKISELNKK